MTPSKMNSNTPTQSVSRETPAPLSVRTENDPHDLVLYCCICFLPISSAKSHRNTDGKVPSFWLTSCGHIVCGNHLFPNGVPAEATESTHNCPYCSSGGISLAGVGVDGEVPQDLRDYFRSQPDLLEDLTGAIKFQYQNLIRIASHYRDLAERLGEKLENQKKVLLKVKDEMLAAKELKKRQPILEEEIASLRQEISQLHQQISPHQHRLPPHPTPNFTSSPSTKLSGSITPLKRKAGDIEDAAVLRAREFRNEINKRQEMPPPSLPISVQPQQQRGSPGDYSLREQREDNPPLGHDNNEAIYNAQEQNQGCYSPRQQQNERYQQSYQDRDSFIRQPAQRIPPPASAINRGDFIDLTDSASRSSPRRSAAVASLPLVPRNDVQHHRGVYSNGYFGDQISLPLSRSMYSGTANNEGGQRVERGYFDLSQPPNPPVTAYTNQMSHRDSRASTLRPPALHSDKIHAPFSYRGAQQTSPSNRRLSNVAAGVNVASPFFSNKTLPSNDFMGSVGSTRKIQRPASAASFYSYNNNPPPLVPRRTGSSIGFLRRRDEESTHTEGRPGYTPTVTNGLGQAFRPQNMVGYSSGRNSNGVRGDAGGGGGLNELLRSGTGRGGVAYAEPGIVDRPGLRRSVRRD